MLDILKSLWIASAAGILAFRAAPAKPGDPVIAVPGSSETPAPQPLARRNVNVPAVRMSAAAHWERIAGVIEAATAAAREAQRIQDAVQIHLQVVEFSLDRIRDEIAGVMVLPRTPEPGSAPETAVAAAHLRAA